jgi:hypothetical protein
MKGVLFMKYFLIAFGVSVGWKLGGFVTDVTYEIIYKLIPEKYKKRRRVSYKRYYD